MNGTPTTAGGASRPAVRGWHTLVERYGLLLLLLLTAATYSGLVGAGFVWDDGGLVVRNRLTPDLGNIPLFFQTDLWDGAPVAPGVSGYYRPLVLVSFAVDRALFDLWAPGHHLHSLLWHLLAVALFERVLRQVLPWPQALAGAAIFALHPAQSEAVAWISARNDPMAAALAFGALLALLPRQCSVGRLLVGGALTWAALLSKESVILLPGLMLLLDLARGGPGPLRRYLPIVAGLGAGVAMRLLAGVAGAAWPGPVGWQLMSQEVVRVVGVYGALLSVAWPLAGIRSLEWLSWEPAWRTVVGVVTAAVIVLAPLVLPGRARRLTLLGLCWLVLAVLPTLIPVVDKGVIGDRYVYLGIAGLALWLAGVAGRAMPAVVLAALLPWQLILWDRLPDWASDLSLWEAALEDTGSPYARAGLGHIWFIEGHPEIALPLFVEALDSDPPALGACDAVGDAALALGRVRLAETLGRWALSRGCPRSGLLTGNLALTQASLGLWDRAARTLAGAPEDPRGRHPVVRAALALHSGDTAAWQAELAASSRPEELATQVERLLASSPRGQEGRLDEPRPETPPVE